MSLVHVPLLKVSLAFALVAVVGCNRDLPPSMQAQADLADRAAKPAPAHAAPARDGPAAAPVKKAAPKPQPAARPEVSKEAMAAAQAKFDTFCFTCHGSSGKGDGPAGMALTPRPRDYTDAVWQDSVTDEYLAKTIVEGGLAVGKSPLMPGSFDLKDKPDVVQGLVNLIRGFKGAP